LEAGSISSVELVAKHLIRIHTYDFRGPCINSIVELNDEIFHEAAASDARRAAGKVIGPLDGIPYTIKDSMKYKGMTFASGSPAFANLMANEDSFVVEQLRKAGAVCVGRTNTPPMMASGMHRGLYGRAESPYNMDYLTAAFSSGSSNGSATSTAASFAAFSLGSETVSSGRSPASNNGLVAYTPSRCVISPRGIWPLYPTCDVLVPHTRTVEDMLTILDVLAVKDTTTKGDFWREQKYVEVAELSRPSSFLDLKSDASRSLQGKRLAVPEMFIGGHDPAAQPIHVSPEVISLWQRARQDLEALGATVVETDFPLVSNYEDDSVSGHTNNVVGFQQDWNSKERRELVAYLWDDFLKANGDPNYPSLATVDGAKMFPRPADYIPDKYMETKNFMNYPGLVELAKERNGKSLWDIEGLAEALPALEAQRQRDLEDWMDEHEIDAVVFPSAGDVGKADLDTNEESARHALQNGVKYSNGNRAIRHMGVPTVSVTMGLMEEKRMPVNLTFAGKHGQDCELLQFAYAYEQATKRRVPPPVTKSLPTDAITSKTSSSLASGHKALGIAHPWFKVEPNRFSMIGMGIADDITAEGMDIYVDGTKVPTEAIVRYNQRQWKFEVELERFSPPETLYGGYGLHVGRVNVVILAKRESAVGGLVTSLPAQDVEARYWSSST
jgi:Asp-tRNA(Asn)/Glu-tRNA(Gln) amidotransferase A subunit family amidase